MLMIDHLTCYLTEVFFTLQKVFFPEVFFHCLSMQRFVSSRRSSSADLASSSLDEVRPERAAIVLSVGLSWPPDRRRRSAGRPPAGSSSGNLLCRSTSSTAMRSRMASAYCVRADGNQERPSARPVSHEDIAHVSTPCAALAAPAAALVEDKTSGSGTKRLKNPRRPHRARLGGQNGDGAAVLVRGLALVPRDVDGINPNTAYRQKRSAHQQHRSASCNASSRRICSPAAWSSSAASSAASKRMRAPRLPVQSSTAHSTTS